MIERGDSGIKVSPSEVAYRYYLYLCDIGGFSNGFEKMPIGTPESCYTYFSLADKLHTIKFRHYVPNDANRVSDALNLRECWANFHSRFASYESIDIPEVSVLEFLIALAQRIDTDIMRGINEDNVDRSRLWVWLMLDNLGISGYDDSGWDYKTDWDVDSKVRTFLDREYDWYGRGGLFPLENTKKDQRTVEIWYQMQEYFDKNYAGINDVFRTNIKEI